jgi:benzylsuccinate CoA-transferase BbsE subunit
METVAVAADGRSVTTGVPPRTGREYRQLLAWLDDLGLRDRFDDIVFLEMGAELDYVDLALIGTDPLTTEIYGSGRSATVFIASHLDAYDFFIQGQQHGLTCGILYSPDEVLDDPHFVSRGFPVTIDDDILGTSYAAPGAPFISDRTTYTVSRAPAVGEHNALLQR